MKILIFLLIISLSCFSKEYKIAYNEGNKIIIINQDGKEIERIILPRKINTFSFTPKMDKVVYDSPFRRKAVYYEDTDTEKRLLLAEYSRIFLYDIEKKSEKQLTKGFYLEKPLYGAKENHCNPDISPDGRYVAFAIGSEEIIKSLDGEPIPAELMELDITKEIGLIEVNTRKFTRLTKDDFCDDLPLWSPDGEKISWLSDGSKKIYNIKNKKITNLEDVYYYPFQWLTSEVWLCIDEDAIVEYNIKTLQKKMLIEFQLFEEGLSFFKHLLYFHMSKDKKYIVFERKYVIYLMDIENKKLRTIKELKEKKRPIGDLEQSIWPKFVQ